MRSTDLKVFFLKNQQHVLVNTTKYRLILLCATRHVCFVVSKTQIFQQLFKVKG